MDSLDHIYRGNTRVRDQGPVSAEGDGPWSAEDNLPRRFWGSYLLIFVRIGIILGASDVADARLQVWVLLGEI